MQIQPLGPLTERQGHHTISPSLSPTYSLASHVCTSDLSSRTEVTVTFPVSDHMPAVSTPRPVVSPGLPSGAVSLAASWPWTEAGRPGVHCGCDPQRWSLVPRGRPVRPDFLPSADPWTPVDPQAWFP